MTEQEYLHKADVRKEVYYTRQLRRRTAEAKAGEKSHFDGQRFLVVYYCTKYVLNYT